MKKLRVTVNGVSYDVDVEILEDDADSSYGYAATNIYAPGSAPPAAAPVAPPPSPAASAPPGSAGRNAKSLTAPIPGVVKEAKVKPGDKVKENDPVVVLEAMKMETVISSPTDGVIKEVLVKASQNVQQGEVLVTFE
jgi:biotin carboxyl carrier protein